MQNADFQMPDDDDTTIKLKRDFPLSLGTDDDTRPELPPPSVMEDENTGRVPVISVRDLTKTFMIGQNKVRALRGVSLDVYPGEFVAIMGPSGSGKSTFMNLIGCLDRPSSGNYWLSGVPVSRLSADKLADVRNQKIGFVFQGFNLLARTTALRNVVLPMMYAGIPWTVQERRAHKALKLVGLKARVAHTPSQLSGGQQQRVAIARALVNNPSLLLADEPTGNLDSKTSVEVMATLQALNEMGLTIVLVTHDAEVAAYARRVVTFHDGHIISDKPVIDRHIVTSSALDLPSGVEVNKVASQRETPPTQLPAADTIAPPRKKAHKQRRGSLAHSNLISATAALWSNRLRSLLTMLGIVIGVAAVISAVTLMEGNSALLKANLSALGTDVLTVSPSFGGAGRGITKEDATAIQQIAHVKYSSPMLTLNGQVVFKDQHQDLQVQGVTVQEESIGNWKLAQGSWFTSEDEQNKAQVAVIGKTVADNLFSRSGTEPLNQTIRINGQTFRIVGVLQAKGSQGIGNQDEVVFIPFSTTAMRLKNTTNIDQIRVQVVSSEYVTEVQQNITTLLQERHHLPVSRGSSTTQQTSSGGGFGPGSSGSSKNSTDDFQIMNANQLLETAQQEAQTQANLLIGIAAISLTVGGIGVMNIMLVSVTERTREIGIRMAIGARRQHIRDQFLIEALTLSTLGGILGILFGLLGGLALINTNSQRLPFQVNFPYMLLAFGVSAAVGIVFGLYPAIRASRLDPIVALRTE